MSQDPVSRRDVFAICDAYESGMGHGLQLDGHKSGAIFENPEHGKAYEIGYEQGEERAREGNKQKPHTQSPPVATVTPPIDPDDPINRLACCIPLADHILTTVAELRSALYGRATPPPLDPELVIDAARARRLERRLREEAHDPERRTGFDRRAHVEGLKP